MRSADSRLARGAACTGNEAFMVSRCRAAPPRLRCRCSGRDGCRPMSDGDGEGGRCGLQTGVVNQNAPGKVGQAPKRSTRCYASSAATKPCRHRPIHRLLPPCRPSTHPTGPRCSLGWWTAGAAAAAAEWMWEARRCPPPVLHPAAACLGSWHRYPTAGWLKGWRRSAGCGSASPGWPPQVTAAGGARRV